MLEGIEEIIPGVSIISSFMSSMVPVVFIVVILWFMYSLGKLNGKALAMKHDKVIEDYQRLAYRTCSLTVKLTEVVQSLDRDIQSLKAQTDRAVPLQRAEGEPGFSV